MSRRVVWDTGKLDPATRLPLCVVDLAELNGKHPDIADIPRYAECLPEGNCSLLVLAGGAPTTPNVPWLLKAHRSLPKQTKKRIRRVYIVHAPWWGKALSSLVNISPKFFGKTVYLRTMSELAQHVDVTTLPLPYNVWFHDLQRSPDGVIVPRTFAPVFGVPLPQTPAPIWTTCLDYLNSLDMLPTTALNRTSGTPEATKVLVLKQAFEREQALDLAEYGPQAVLALLKLYLLELPEPLVHLDDIPLPMEDTKEYATSVLDNIQAAQIAHLQLFMDWFIRAADTHGVDRMAEFVGPAITGVPLDHGDNVRISNRFMRNLGEHWPVQTSRKGLRPSRFENALNAPHQRRKISGPRVAELVERYEPGSLVDLQ